MRSKTRCSRLTLGAVRLEHRIVMAPLTRSRSVRPDSVPGPLMKACDEQRAGDGGLQIAEATNISLSSRGWLGASGHYSDAPGAGWRAIVGAVEARGDVIFARLWHTGRSSVI